jgi:hypothetical protein
MKKNKLKTKGMLRDDKAQAAVWGLLTVLVLLILAAGLVDIYRLYAARAWAYSVAQEAALAGVSKARQWDDFMSTGTISLDERIALTTAQAIVQSAMQVRGITDYQIDIRVQPDASGGSIPDFPPHSVRLGEGLGNWFTDVPAVGIYLEVPVQWTLLDLFDIPEKGVRVFAAAGVAQ